MDAITTYTYSTAGWFGIQAVPLLLFPRLIIAMLSRDDRHSTDLENYFCRSLSLTLLTLALVTLILTGSLPLTHSFPETSSSSSSTSHPLALPTLVLTTAFHSCTAFYAYMQYTNTQQTAFALSITGSGTLAAMGIWCLLFGTSGERSRKQKDRVSGWPFKNQAVELSKLDRKGKRI